MTFRRLIAIGLCGLVIAAAPGPAWAGENEMMDALIHKLVDKGVLTREEAREIRQEVAEEIGKSGKSREADAKDLMKKEMSNMIANAKWSGDLRLRHETQRREPAVDRSRERFRLRLGFTTKPVDPLEIGVRIATGASGDPVSTNQSFTNTFDKKAVFFDMAYAKYSPFKWANFIGGKMENPFVTIPENIVWDGDVTPEGVAMQLKSQKPVPILDRWLPVTPFLNAGGFVISELSNDAGDPALFGFQSGIDVELPWWQAIFQPSVAYYNFSGIKGVTTANVANSPAGNTTITEGASRKFATDYDIVAWQSKLSIPSLFGQPVNVLADYTFNNEENQTSDEANVDDGAGYVAGVEVGKVTEKFGSWKAYYFRKWLESDAAFGAIADSDFGAGGTNHKGHIFGVQMGLNKWASVGLRYLRTDEIEGTQNRVDTLQADTVVKF